MQQKKEMSGLDILAIVKEFEEIIGGKIDKIYQIDDIIRVRFYSYTFGRKDIIIDINGKIYISNTPPPAPKNPTGFAMLLRKYISGGAILSIYQYLLDRIVIIEIGRGGKRYNLLVELFAGGNVLLLDDNFEIVGWKDNVIQGSIKIKTGDRYTFPEEIFTPLYLDFLREHLHSIFLTSEKNIVETIALTLGFGGVYAEEICIRCNVDKKASIKDLSEEEIERLTNEIYKLLSSVNAGEIKPNIVYSSKKPIGFFPIDMQSFSKYEKRYFERFNNCIDEYFQSIEEKKTVELKNKDKKKNGGSKVERIISRQEAAIKEYKNRSEENKEIGDLIYERYTLINEILSIINKATERYSFDDIKKLLNKKRDAGIKGLDYIKDIDGAAKKITLNIDGRSIDLFLEKNLSNNAEEYYEKSKKFKKKMDGAIKSRDIFLKELEKAKKKEKQDANRILVIRRRDKRWYHRFRWFYSSDGFLIIGGKDADSNEEIVSKYMEKNDIFFHADIQGAPATVIKTNNKEVPLTTMEEAAIFATSYSNFWKIGAFSGDCYWVYPEQVSKTPESGEYVPKGSFIIRGKRNYFKEVKMDVSIGLSLQVIGNADQKDQKGLILDNISGVIGGPKSAISKRAKYIVELEPGELNPNDVAKRIYRYFMKEIRDITKRSFVNHKPLVCDIPKKLFTQEDIANFMPPGNSRIITNFNL
ncbi:MAG: fibronectin-binding domain-containing protein [Candidatus Methanoliparum thermophilum]|uniref:Fibronectin-binding domain-containing protein n=1 Tax=Methanoliparum thermophilum TaxID=2491083 RepID=A0A520KQR0_METT2|nr:ribosome rescue protein RqcH [Candidatus Methanoliparum sp. LAM-1]RZN63877.1 MAG: fibronectin-binding domain-containing protein [Candidatus Methanoliparum thermophilum]BDC36393.1 fibronectin-binding protein [Candidatus Methanoliparum sp. LAM-1]